MSHQYSLIGYSSHKTKREAFYIFIAPIVIFISFSIQPLSAQSDNELATEQSGLIQLFRSEGYDGADSNVAPELIDSDSQTAVSEPRNATQRNASINSENRSVDDVEVAEEAAANKENTDAQPAAQIINTKEATRVETATIEKINPAVNAEQLDAQTDAKVTNVESIQSPQIAPEDKSTEISDTNTPAPPENRKITSYKLNLDLERSQPIIPPPPARPHDQNTQALFEALSNQNIPSALSLISLGADVNAINNNGQTMLMMAIINADAAVVREMLDQGANINARNKWGWSALLSATIKGKKEIVEILLDAGADSNMIGNDGRSAVMAASWNRNHGILNVLINSDADVNIKNRDGWTALSFAAWNGDETAVRVLLNASADKTICNNEGETALMIAQQAGHPDIAHLLR